MLESYLELGLEPRAKREQSAEFSRRERTEVEEIAFHLAYATQLISELAHS
jgi:hypothetical protein